MAKKKTAKKAAPAKQTATGKPAAKAPAIKKAATKKAAAKKPPAVGSQTVKEILRQLEALGNATMRAHNTKHGAGDNQFGVKLGDLRVVANQYKTNHELALELWETGIIEAQLLTTLMIKPKALSAEQLERMVQAATYVQLADWLHSYVVKEHPEKDSLRQKWMTTSDPMAARAGWRLTAGRVAKSPDGIDVVALLDRLEAEMGSAPPVVQWTMNACLAEIGINFPKHRKRAIAIGEKLGIYRDYPVSKGCTSPFAPIWIEAMVARQR
jgi:3-methyladenine DNA glycosylase AlkD